MTRELNMTDELKPCPFCGGAADIDQPPGKGSERLVYCKGCFASICEDSTPNAIAAWNRRAILAAPGAPAPATWDEARRVCNLPSVGETIRNLIEDPTGTNATCLVRAVLSATSAPAQAPVAGPGVGPPTYYVRHPDDSCSVADPQPGAPAPVAPTEGCPADWARVVLMVSPTGEFHSIGGDCSPGPEGSESIHPGMERLKARFSRPPAPVAPTDVPTHEQVTAALKAACFHDTPESRKDMTRALIAASKVSLPPPVAVTPEPKE